MTPEEIIALKERVEARKELRSSPVEGKSYAFDDLHAPSSIKKARAILSKIKRRHAKLKRKNLPAYEEEVEALKDGILYLRIWIKENT